MSALSQQMEETAAATEAMLERLLPPVEGPRGRVVEAMRYACLGGGKRLRPFLLVRGAALFDVPDERALRAAAAVEMVHCYSLAHDDLPAMDDSDLRRGRPSVHKAFDEATSILAGDGLLTEAFAVLAAAETHPEGAVRADLVARLAAAAGAEGMVGGQMIDIAAEHHGVHLSQEDVAELQRLKTGAIIGFAATAGAVLAEAGTDAEAALAGYARDLGLAFQIADDLLDIAGDAKEIGKPVGQDAAAGKATFVDLLGVEGARRRAGELADSAVGYLAGFCGRADPLRDVARFVVERRS
ncbi:MAG: polyprenyl synthetase family protein [Rhodovibrionaceae bacterium]|nr:polyprenyl synthetase family protein [Rhodovibrionaceae bacterium]